MIAAFVSFFQRTGVIPLTKAPSKSTKNRKVIVMEESESHLQIWATEFIWQYWAFYISITVNWSC